MNRPGRMMIAALVLLMVLAPGAATAGESDDAPLANVPDKYAPVIDAAADELGVSASELQSASRAELRTLVCDQVDGSSTSELVTRVKRALESSPPKEYSKLSSAERQQVEEQLPKLIGQVDSAYCQTSTDAASSGSGEDTTGGAAATDSSIPTPTRVDTGGGGAATAGAAPLLFGVLFAGLFGMFGVGLTGRRRRDT